MDHGDDDDDHGARDLGRDEHGRGDTGGLLKTVVLLVLLLDAAAMVLGAALAALLQLGGLGP